MKRLLLLVCLGLVVYAKPSHHPYNDVYPIHPGVGAIYKGPNSETIIEGPDGSVITSEADGGAVAVKGDAAVVEAHAAVEASHAVSHASAEAVAHQAIASEAIAHHAAGQQVITHQARSHQAVSASAGAYVQTNVVAETPVVVAKAPVVVEEPVLLSAPAPQVVLTSIGKDTATLDGPSGSILRHGEDAVISGPSSVTIKDGKHVVDIPNIEVKSTVVESHPPGVLINPGHISVAGPDSYGPFVSSTPRPILVDASVRPLKPRPVLIDTPHPVKPLVDPVPVLVDDTHLVGSTLGTSGPIVVDDINAVQKELILSTPGPILHDYSPVSIHNDVAPQVIVSSTPAPILYSGAPIVVAPSKAELSPPAVSLSPPLIHSGDIYSTPASHVLGHANEEAISAAIAKNAEAQQSYLSALQYAEYEKALAAETERKYLEAAIHSSGGNAGHGIINQHYLNPVVSQGNHIISGGVVSSTLAPVGIVSSTPPPVLVTSLPPAKIDAIRLENGLVAVGPQVFQTNGIVSVTPKPEIIVSSTHAPQPAINLVSSEISSTIGPDTLVNSNPIVSRPTAVLTSSSPKGLGQIVVQSKTVSSSEQSSHSSSVQSSSSTGIISGPVIVGDGSAPNIPHGPPFPSPDYVDWHRSVSKHGYHGGDRGFPVHRSFLH